MAAGRQNQPGRRNWSMCANEREGVTFNDDAVDSIVGQDRCTDPARFFDQRIEHVTRAIGIGKQLALVLFVHWHSDFPKKCDRLGNAECPEHVADE